MGNCKFTLEDCVIEMRSEALARTRYNPKKDEFDTWLTLSQAYEVAQRTLEKIFQTSHLSPAPPKPKVEAKQSPLPGLGGPDVTTHKEKSFKFADGSIARCCAAAYCGWGRTRKTHSDGMTGETLYALVSIPDTVEPEDEVERSSDDARELTIEGWASASPVESEDGLVPELIDDTDSPSEEDEETEPCLA